MKLVIDRYAYERPGISIIPETDYEAAVLTRYWEHARLSTGRAKSEDRSANGMSYGIKFTEPQP